MKTTLSPEKLAELHGAGRVQADKDKRFVNPDTAALFKKILRERGEEWAESVLLRRFTRRSLALPQYPWLEHGEMETLVLAAEAELEQLRKAVDGQA